jgi:hypothetical protein
MSAAHKFPTPTVSSDLTTSGGVDEAIRQSPKRLVDAQREVRAFIVVGNRGESHGTGAEECRAWPGPKGHGEVRREATGRERRETDADE